MAKKTAYSVHVVHRKPVNPDRPELGSNVVKEETFPPGSTLPKWAKDLVGDHVYSEDDGVVDPTDLDDDGQDDSDPEKPAGNASLEAWQEYAAAQGKDVDGKGRDEIRDLFA